MSDTKHKIVQTMFKLISEKGYEKASIGQISKELGIKKPSVYYHFKNKEEIFLDTINAYLIDNGASLETYLSETDISAFKKKIIEYGYIQVDLYEQNLYLAKFTSEVHIQSTRLESVNHKLVDSDTKFQHDIYRTISHGKEIGAIRANLDSKIAMEMIHIFINGLEDSIIYSEQKFELKKAWRTFITWFFTD